MTGGPVRLRVVWPIVDDAMFDREALTAAWFDWPSFLDVHEVEPVDNPHMRVVDLADIDLNTEQQAAFQHATRAVVFEAPVAPRSLITCKGRAA